jgi:SAM-dependent methyltransferase
VDRDAIKKHWERSAQQHGSALAATTNTDTIKQLEIDALHRAVRRITDNAPPALRLLEVGCGNGFNCVALARLLPRSTVVGVDLIEEMVHAAKQARDEAGLTERIDFYVGDASDLSGLASSLGSFDIAFTDRCIINLPSDSLQMQAIDELISFVRPGGHLLILENVTQAYDRQNQWRVAAGLQPRTPAPFNRFVDEDVLLKHAESRHLDLISVDEFGSLHDLVLYVLVPMTNGGQVEYDHPSVRAVTMLSLNAADDLRPFPGVGQNRLYVLRRG